MVAHVSWEVYSLPLTRGPSLPNDAQVLDAWQALSLNQGELDRWVRLWKGNAKQTWNPLPTPGAREAHKPPQEVHRSTIRQHSSTARSTPCNSSTPIEPWPGLRLLVRFSAIFYHCIQTKSNKGIGLSSDQSLPATPQRIAACSS